MIGNPSVSTTVTLFDDESVRKKLTVMSKFEAALDDARNPDDHSGAH